MALLFVQAVTPLPDIEISAVVRARSLTIQKRGDARLTISAEPEGANVVDVQAPKANGRKVIRNVAVDVKAEARIADPQLNVLGTATAQPE